MRRQTPSSSDLRLDSAKAMLGENAIALRIDASDPADERVRADARELMGRRATTHDREIADLAMSGQHHVV